jgi:signal transduction histidine kinase
MDIPPSLWGLVDGAVSAVDAGWQEVAEDTPAQQEVRAQLGAIRVALERTATGAWDAGGVPRTILGRRLLDLVRREVLRLAGELSPAPATAPLLALLEAIERLHRALEPDWAQHFADRLSGPDGMDLVVEVAHDLRSPLTSILFLAETLQRGRSGTINPVQERQLGLIYSAAFGLSSLASDVIELARGGDRLVDVDPLPFSVADILESVRDIVQPIAEEKGLQVRLQPPAADFRIGHPVAVSRVLLNLTTNALKFTSEGFVEVRAEQGEGTQIRFSVRDTGRGIPPQAILTLFEPFRRRQTQGEYAFSGAGLGLSICRKLVEAMHSTLEVETSPDQGTRFHFLLDLPLATNHM